jgi:hypothetical protein
MKPTPQELEQEALLKNFLDGLEPLEAEKTRSALRGVSSLPTVEEEYLESFPDLSTDTFDVDRPEWKLAEELNLGLEEATRVLEWHQVELARELDWEIARILSKVLSELIRPCKNIRARVYGLIFATGLDQANGLHSQAEIARELGCTRALISHYTIQWVEIIKVGIFKFRKSEDSRKTYKDSAIRTTVDRKLWSWAKGNSL